jgi:2-dehydro-3-deoxyphosphooctonate aldolase (KDO 8-P synthase)
MYTFIATTEPNRWRNRRKDMIETIAKAGIAVGVDGIFIETHFDPANAKVMEQILHIDYFEALMTKLVAIRKTINTF